MLIAESKLCLERTSGDLAHLDRNGLGGNITPLESLRSEHNKNNATLPKEIMDFPSCILYKKFNQFIKGGYHVGLVTKFFIRQSKDGKYYYMLG